MSAGPAVLVFDSGVGGLSVHGAIRAARPDARFVYAADNAAFPYGDLEESALVARVVEVVGAFVDHYRPDIAVIACNTASTLALTALRRALGIEVVGTVPAIKVAAERSASGVIGVLSTPGTARREYTTALIDAYAQGREVVLVGARHLAGLAERALAGERIALADVRREIAPAFVARGRARTDVVVLACTHYPLIADEITAAAPWPVELIDPAPAIARRVLHFIGDGGAGGAVAAVRGGGGRAVFTAPERVGPALRRALARRGLGLVEGLDLPFAPAV